MIILKVQDLDKLIFYRQEDKKTRRLASPKKINHP
jgi:hypothetical protein